MPALSSTGQTSSPRSHYVTLRYEVQGFEPKTHIKLFHSPSIYGIKKEAEIDLFVLDSAPHKPFIRAVYLGRAGQPVRT